MSYLPRNLYGNRSWLYLAYIKASKYFGRIELKIIMPPPRYIFVWNMSYTEGGRAWRMRFSVDWVTPQMAEPGWWWGLACGSQSPGPWALFCVLRDTIWCPFVMLAQHAAVNVLCYNESPPNLALTLKIRILKNFKNITNLTN